MDKRKQENARVKRSIEEAFFTLFPVVKLSAELPPLKEGATMHHLKAVCCVLPEAPCREQMIFTDFQSAPIITGEATLPLRWLPPATP